MKKMDYGYNGKRRGCLIKINEQCNQKCIFCHSEYDKSNEIDIETLKRKISTFKKNITSVLISGGEPTLNKDIIEIIDEFKKDCIRFSIVTNGSRPEILEKIVELGPEMIFISFYSINPDVDKAMTQGDFFTKRMESIDILEKSHVPAIANIIITRLNIKSLKETCDYLRKKGIKTKLTYPLIIGNARKNFERIYVSNKEIKEIISSIKPDYVEDIPPCISHSEQFSLDKLGFTMKKDVLGEKGISITLNKNIRTEFCDECKCKMPCTGILENNYFILKEKRLLDKFF